MNDESLNLEIIRLCNELDLARIDMKSAIKSLDRRFFDESARRFNDIGIKLNIALCKANRKDLNFDLFRIEGKKT